MYYAVKSLTAVLSLLNSASMNWQGLYSPNKL